LLDLRLGATAYSIVAKFDVSIMTFLSYGPLNKAGVLQRLVFDLSFVFGGLELRELFRDMLNF
jgi:hypothetical protein